MRIAGKKIEGPNVEMLVIPRTNTKGEQNDIVFYAQAVLDMSEFDKMIPTPEPKTAQYPDGTKKLLTDDPDFVKAQNDWGKRRFQYIMLKSLEATPDLEFETVKINDPATWDNWETEVKEAGFSDFEISRIRTVVMEANALSEARLQEARDRFLATVQSNGQAKE